MKNQFKKLILLTLFFPTAALADDTAQWEAILKRPDVEIKTRSDGHRTAHFKGGVTIDEIGKEWDNNPGGGVRCGWDMYVAVKNGLEICKLPNSAHIDYAIEKTKAFIVANNIMPITEADLDAEIAQKLEAEKVLYDKASEKRRAQMCIESPPIAIEKSISAMPLDQFKQALDQSLSVPRPPVSKPCM